MFDDEMPESPTTALIRALADSLRDREWVNEYERCPRGCCGEWHTRCSWCGADEGDYAEPGYRTHKDGCGLKALLDRAEATIAAEEQERQREEAHLARKTAWEHLQQEVSHG